MLHRILLLALCCSVLVARLALADDLPAPISNVIVVNGDDSNDSPGNHEEDPVRSFSYSVNTNDVEAEAQFEAGSVQQTLRLRAAQDEGGARFRARYSTSGTGPSSEFEVKFRLKEIVEYNYTDATVGYQPGVSQIVNNYTHWAWDPVTDSDGNTGVAAGGASSGNLTPAQEEREFRLRTKDRALLMFVKYNYQYSSTAMTVGPNDMKFDLVVNHTALREMGWLATTGTQLAFRGILQIKSSLEASKSDDAATESGSIDVTAGGSVASGSFSWVSFVQCGPTKISLKTSSMMDDNSQSEDAGESAKVVWWSVMDTSASTRDGTCTWDPVIGVVTPGSAGSVVASMALIVLATLVALLF